jgi:hypothetical protein
MNELVNNYRFALFAVCIRITDEIRTRIQCAYIKEGHGRILAKSASTIGVEFP